MKAAVQKAIGVVEVGARWAVLPVVDLAPPLSHGTVMKALIKP